MGTRSRRPPKIQFRDESFTVPQFRVESFAVPLSPVNIRMSKGEMLKAKGRWDKALKDGKPVPWSVRYVDGRPDEVEMLPYPADKGQPSVAKTPAKPSHRPQSVSLAEIDAHLAAVPADRHRSPKQIAANMTEAFKRKGLDRQVNASSVRRRLADARRARKPK